MEIKPLHIVLLLAGVAMLLVPGGTANAALFNLISSEEGLKLIAYPDAGKYAIGYGSQFHWDLGRDVKAGDRITQETARRWFDKDTAQRMAAINKLVKVPINRNQLYALTDLTYNIGVPAFSNSTLLKSLNAGKPKQTVADLFNAWVYSKNSAGVTAVNPTLVARRKRDRALFLS